MSFKKKLSITAILLIIVIFSVAYGITITPKEKLTLTISAAASMSESMEEIKTLYANEKSNVEIVYNFGASGSLEQQIEQGAESDIFISAAPKQMNMLQDKSLILTDSRINLVENKIVLITQKDNTTISNFEDITTNKVSKLAVGEPTSVPVGQYAQEVFTKLNIADKVKSKFVYAKDVKEVLTWVESGNAAAGIVYATDALTSDKVKVVSEAPEGSHSQILCPAAIVKTSKNSAESKEFMTFLSSSKAKATFEKYGFTFVGK